MHIWREVCELRSECVTCTEHTAWIGLGKLTASTCVTRAKRSALGSHEKKRVDKIDVSSEANSCSKVCSAPHRAVRTRRAHEGSAVECERSSRKRRDCGLGEKGVEAPVLLRSCAESAPSGFLVGLRVPQSNSIDWWFESARRVE